MKQWIVKRCLGYLLLGGMVVSGLLGCSDKPVDYFPGYGEADYVRLSAPLSGTLRQLQLVRGGAARAGNPAFVLEQDSERAAHDEAIARLQQAQATLADLQKGKRPDEMAALQAQVQQTQAALQLAQSDLQRQQKLVDTHFIAPMKSRRLNRRLPLHERSWHRPIGRSVKNRWRCLSTPRWPIFITVKGSGWLRVRL